MQLRKCIICGKEFEPVKMKQRFCCRKCYIIDYRIKSKIKTLPYYICQKCGKKTQLKFDPKSNIKRFERFKCPCCEYNRKKGIRKAIKKEDEKEKMKKIIYD